MLPGAAQRHSPPAVLPVAYLIPSEPLSRYMSASVPFLEFVACRRVEKMCGVCVLRLCVIVDTTNLYISERTNPSVNIPKIFRGDEFRIAPLNVAF